MRLDICNCVDSYELIREKVKEICDSKSNITKDCGGKPSCPHRFTKITACLEKACAGEKATTPCPMIFFHTNASLEAFCDHNGSWNFSPMSWKGKCTPLTVKEQQEVVDRLLDRQKEDSTTERYQLKVYVTFSWISLSFMIPTLFVLFYFMDRKNIRFNLHKNLICAFLFRVVTFFVDHYGDLIQADRTICNAFWVLNRFFAISEVTWMLNEAIFLLKLLFRTFDAKSYFWGFFAFGWGFPAILVFAIYIPVMVYYLDKEMKICWITEKDSLFMFILYGPMTLMLLINFATLIYVIYVLLDKLRTSTTSDLLRIKKGIKAALILMPLLGVIYLMILYVPKSAPIWYNYLIRILYPMQGTLACLVYVVFNGEVRQAIKTRWNRWLHTKSEFLERVRYRGIARIVFSTTDTNTTTCDQITDVELLPHLSPKDSCTVQNTI